MVLRLWLSLFMVAASVSCAYAQATLDKVRASGTLRCGIPITPEDWNKVDLHGPLAPLDVEICKAVAVTALGNKVSVDLRHYATEQEAEEGLDRAEVDLVVGVTPDATAMWRWPIAFGPPIFYDGLGILVRAEAPAAHITDIAGLRICVIEGTDNEKILLAHTVARGIAIVPLPFQEEGEMDEALVARHCDGLAAYVSRLAVVKATYPGPLGADRILPDLLMLAPVAPAYRADDRQWRMLVDWTIHALVQAEESGVAQENVDAQRRSEDPLVQRLLGIDWSTSRALKIDRKDWAAQVIAVVGNYGEIYERTVGSASRMRLPRGLNALWSKGGLLHHWPVQ